MGSFGGFGVRVRLRVFWGSFWGGFGHFGGHFGLIWGFLVDFRWPQPAKSIEGSSNKKGLDGEIFVWFWGGKRGNLGKFGGGRSKNGGLGPTNGDLRP